MGRPRARAASSASRCGKGRADHRPNQVRDSRRDGGLVEGVPTSPGMRIRETDWSAFDSYPAFRWSALRLQTVARQHRPSVLTARRPAPSALDQAAGLRIRLDELLHRALGEERAGAGNGRGDRRLQALRFRPLLVEDDRVVTVALSFCCSISEPCSDLFLSL